MNCPVCSDTRMREVEKDGILIDVCPSCKGVWLDRGELDKLMEGVKEVRQQYNQWYYDDDDDDHKRRYPQQQPYPQQQAAYPPQQAYPQQQYPPQQGYPPQQQYYDDKHYKKYPYKKKKKSVLDVFGDLFD